MGSIKDYRSSASEYQSEYRSIVCSVNDSSLSLKGEETAAYLSKLSGARLILLTVVNKWNKAEPMTTDSREWSDIHDMWLGEGRALLEKAEDNLREQGVINIETVLREGEIITEIIAEASKRKADLIVMSLHRIPMKRFLPWSIMNKITRKAPCPVYWVFD